jgi:O-antigen ligase
MFLITGLTNLAIRHDIMDAVFMIFLVVGLYLAIGTSARSRADVAAPVGSPAA